MIPLGAIIDASFVWVFEFWSLEIVCGLSFVIWIFSAQAPKVIRNRQTALILILGILGISQYLLPLLQHISHIGAILADYIEGFGQRFGVQLLNLQGDQGLGPVQCF